MKKNQNLIPGYVLKKESIGTCRNAIDHIVTAHNTTYMCITYASFEWGKISFDEILIFDFGIEMMSIDTMPFFEIIRIEMFTSGSDF